MKHIMKKLLLIIRLSVALCCISFLGFAQNCIIDPPSSFNGQNGGGATQSLSTVYESKDGWYLPTAGEVRILFVFYEVNYIGGGIDPRPNDTVGWPTHQLPVWANDIADVHAPSGASTKPLTRYFQLASSGNFTVLGDYLVAPSNGGLFRVSSSTGNVTRQQIVDSVNAALGTSIVTGSILNSITHFDKWTIDNTPTTGEGLPKTTPSSESPAKYDHVMFICRNGRKSDGSENNGDGDAYPWGSSYSMLGYHANTDSHFGSGVDLPFNIIRHEFSHLLYGGNNFHCGGGGNGVNYWIPLIGGWSNMSLYNGSLNSWNAWDRLRMDWKAAGVTNGINARNAAGKVNVNGDLDATNPAHAGTYTLRDFVLFGDAIRIKLPFTNPATEYPQWLWIENHQGQNVNGVAFDKWLHEGNACIDPVVPGIYAYLQIDKEERTSTSQSVLFGGYMDYLRPLTADGFCDREFESGTTYNNCIQWGNTNAFTKLLPNPLTGGSDQEYYAIDKLGNAQINDNDNYMQLTELNNGNYNHHTYMLGNSRHAFTLSGNKKIGMGTNPSSASMMNMVGYGTALGGTKNLRKIYLNGVSVEILSYGLNNTIKVQVRFDDVDIADDVRWCADTIVLNPIASPSGYSMNIKNSKIVTLDQGTTATRMNNPQTINGKQVFASPTRFNTRANAYIHLENNAQLIADHTSTLALNAGSKLELESGAKLIIRNNSQLVLENGSQLIVKGTAQVVVETGGKLLYNGGTIKLNDNTSTIEIKDGFLEIAANQVFTYTGSTSMVYGYIKFTSPSFPSTNIIAGAGSSINITGFTKTKTIFEVTQETMALPMNLALFKIKNGSVLLGAGARVLFSDGNTAVDINNCRFGSNTGTKTTHRGLVLYGQSNVAITNSTFENGTYGVYGWLTYGGAPHTFNYCTFQNNDIGLFSHDKGITLNNCSFYKNSQYGWYAEAMSFNCFANNCSFGESLPNANATALYFQGAYNISLKVDNPAISYNTNGIIVSGTTAYVRCGFVKNNSGNGFEIIDYGTLDMGDNWDSQPSKVIATNNGTTIKSIGAFSIDLDNGRNALYPSVQGQQKVVNGTIAGGCAPFMIPAFNNQWKTGGGSPTNTDYFLQTYDPYNPCPLQSVIISDATPITATACPGGGLPSLVSGFDTLAEDNSNESNVNLDVFNDDLAKMNMSRAASDYTDALSRINLILSGTLNDEQRVIAENWQCIIQSEINQVSASTENINTPISTVENCSGSAARVFYSNQTHNETNANTQNSKMLDENAIKQLQTDKFKVKILPNPNNGNFELNIESDKESFCELTMFDITGKIIYIEKFSISSGNNVKLFSKNIDKAVYIVNIKNEFGDNKNIKLIIE